MVDYLEERLDHVRALMEQVRQMERSMYGLRPDGGSGETWAGSDTSREGNRAAETEKSIVSINKEKVYNLKNLVKRLEGKVDNLNFSTENQVEQAEQNVNRSDSMVDILEVPGRTGDTAQESGEDTEKPQTNLEKAEKSGVPLAVQLEELDRAVSSLTAAVPEGAGTTRGRFPDASSNFRRLESASSLSAVAAESGDSRSGVSLSTPSGVMNWAEQADRVFRRDSRRYDGGFSLY